MEQKHHEHKFNKNKNHKPSTWPIQQAKFATMEDLIDNVLDLSDTQRAQQAAAKDISDALQQVVNTKNNAATGYLAKFRQREQEHIANKIWRQYFGYQKKETILSKIHKDNTIYQQRKAYEDAIKNLDRKLKKEYKKQMYETLKRLYNKKITTHHGNDIDKDASVFLLQLAGFFKDQNHNTVAWQSKTVANDAKGDTGLQADSWGTRDGIDILNYNKTKTDAQGNTETMISLFNTLAIVDEHHNKLEWAKNITKPTSSTHIIHTLLKQLDVLNPKFKDQIQRFVDFVDKADSQYYQFVGADYKNSHKTIFGMHRQLPIKTIYKYFEDPQHTGFEVLSEKELLQWGIKEQSEKVKKLLKNKREEYEDLEAKWRFGKFNNTKFIFALNQELNGWQQVSAWMGESGVFKLWNTGDIYMYSPKILPKQIAGKSTDGHFLNIKEVSVEDLQNILDQFEFGKDAQPGLKEHFIQARKDQLQQTKLPAQTKTISPEVSKDIQSLPALSLTQLHKDKKYEGIINSINGKHIYVNLSPEIVGKIIEPKKDKTLYVGQKIKVAIKEITNNGEKTYIALEKTA